jgi:hypothetical protein
MGLLMREDCLDSAAAVEFVDFLFPFAAAIERPLKRERLNLPVLRVKLRREFQSGTQDFALLQRVMRFAHRATQWKIEKASPWRFDALACLPKHTRTQGRKSSRLECPGNQSHGLMARWSKREQ